MRHKDANVNLPPPNSDGTRSWDSFKVGMLMDLRDEAKRTNELLERLVAVLECHNTTAIPHTLARIDRRLAKAAPLK